MDHNGYRRPFGVASQLCSPRPCGILVLRTRQNLGRTKSTPSVCPRTRWSLKEQDQTAQVVSPINAEYLTTASVCQVCSASSAPLRG